MIADSRYYMNIMMEIETDMNDPNGRYPPYVCEECAYDNGGWADIKRSSTFHENECGWCNKFKTVSTPRTYNYPKYKPKD